MECTKILLCAKKKKKSLIIQKKISKFSASYCTKIILYEKIIHRLSEVLISRGILHFIWHPLPGHFVIARSFSPTSWCVPLFPYHWGGVIHI